MLDPKLKDYAAPRQAQYIDAVNEHGGPHAAARALGINVRNLQRGIKTVQAKAALQGYSPDHDMTRTVPDGFKVRGVSTYYNSEGVAAGQWVKSTADEERRQELIRAAAEALAEEMPRLDPLEGPPQTLAKLANLYVVTDYHVGMMAWRREGGADWDLKIAEQTLIGCFEQMILRSPRARVGILAQLGDFLHMDGLLPVTPTSGHVLDADGRYSKVVGVAMRLLRRLIDMMLMRHDEVHVILAEGNHDIASSVWLRHMFAALYEKEPRVVINDSELPYYVHQHGKNMLCFHHGHLKKLETLPLLFAAEFPHIWGATEYRVVHAGHNHHEFLREFSGMTAHQHPTLAARDAHASRHGWHAERNASCLSYHEEHGKVGTVTVRPEMLEAA